MSAEIGIDIDQLARSLGTYAASDNSTRTIAKTVGVLLIGADFQAVGVARSLAEECIPVALLETEAGIARFSNAIGQRFVKRDLLNSGDSVEYMLRLAEKHGLEGWSVFCVNDKTIEFLAKNHEALSTKYVLSVLPWATTQKFYEKDQAGEAAAQAGIPIPRVYPSSTLEELLASEPEYPVVFKPTFKKNYYDKTNDKAVLAKDRESLVREYQAMNRLIATRQILVQEFLGGGTKNLFSFAAVFNGEKVLAGVSAHRIRQHPMDFGHATTYAESRDMPQLEELATQFFKQIGYRGVAEVEFILDERTGQYKFIEMNGRFWGWHTLTRNAGLNFPVTLFQMLNGVSTTRVKPTINATWVRMLTDIPTVLTASMQGRMSVTKIFQAIGNHRTDAVWSLKDPLPFLMEAAMAPYLWWKKGF
jgi:D-aspartate ligase